MPSTQLAYLFILVRAKIKPVMKYIIPRLAIVVSLSFVLFISSCIGSIHGNGNVKKVSREVSEFSKISIEGGYEVFLRQGSQCMLEVEADENLHKHIITKNQGSWLKVSTDEPIHGSKALRLYITVVDLDEVDISGAVELRSKSVIKTNTLSLDLSGAGNIEMDVDANELDFDLSGGSEISIKGRAAEASFDISGAGELEAEELETDYMDIDISGAGSATVFVNKELDAEISGAGSIRYKGNPVVSKDVNGAGSISSID